MPKRWYSHNQNARRHMPEECNLSDVLSLGHGIHVAVVQALLGYCAALINRRLGDHIVPICKELLDA
jgi:hypothetical protein